MAPNGLCATSPIRWIRRRYRRTRRADPLAALLHEPFAQLGSADPALDAALAAHATVGAMAGYLWRRSAPTPAEVDHIAEFCLRAVSSGHPVAAVSRSGLDHQ